MDGDNIFTEHRANTHHLPAGAPGHDGNRDNDKNFCMHTLHAATHGSTQCCPLAGKAAHTPCLLPTLDTTLIHVRGLQVRQLLLALELIKDVLVMALDVLCQLLLEQGGPALRMRDKASLSIAFCSQVRWVGWLQTPKY